MLTLIHSRGLTFIEGRLYCDELLKNFLTILQFVIKLLKYSFGGN